MKKLYSFFLLAMCGIAANAQSFSVTYEGTPVSEGSTVEVKAVEEVTEIFGTKFTRVECEPKEPLITNNSSSDISFIVTVTKGSKDDQLTWCGITSQCAPMQGMSENRQGISVAGSSTPLELHANFTAGTYATYNAKVSIMGGGETLTFNMKFVYDETSTGIKAVESAAASREWSLQNGTFSYAFATAADYQLNVYSIAGQQVKSEKLGLKGDVSLNDLPAGIYVCEVKKNGERTRSQKVSLK